MRRRRERTPPEGVTSYQSPDITAKVLGVSATLVFEGCRAGWFPHRRLGRRILIDPQEVAAYLARTGVSLEQAVQRTVELGLAEVLPVGGAANGSAAP